MANTQAVVERCGHAMLAGRCVVKSCHHYDGGTEAKQRAAYLARRDPVSAPVRGEAMRIAEMVCDEYRIPVDDVMSEMRYSELIEPRQVVFYVCRHAHAPKWSFSSIGRAFQRDHTTILTAVRKLERRANCNPAFAERLERFVLRAQGAVLVDAPISTPDIPDLEVT